MYHLPHYEGEELFEGEFTSKMSFVADVLLEKPIAFDDSNAYGNFLIH